MIAFNYHFDQLWLIFNFSRTHPPEPTHPNTESTYFFGFTEQKLKQKLNARSQSISQNRFKDPSKVHDYIQTNIRMPNPSQEPPASSKAPNRALKDMDVICTLKIKIAKIWIMGISKTSDHIQIKIKTPNPSQEPPAPSKAPNEDLKDMDVLCTFKIKIENQNLEHRCSKDQ